MVDNRHYVKSPQTVTQIAVMNHPEIPKEDPETQVGAAVRVLVPIAISIENFWNL